MYEDLIKRLKNVSINFGQLDHVSVLLLEAADAIEELFGETERLQKVVIKLENDLGIYDELPITYQVEVSKVENTTHWIPVTERLPETPGEYMVAYHPCCWDIVLDEIEVGIDSFHGKTSWAKKKYQRVTHWMPLPEPPKEEQFGKTEQLKQEYYHAFCSRCGRPVIAKKEEAFWWPGGTTDDHLCISCDICGGLAEV